MLGATFSSVDKINFVKFTLEKFNFLMSTQQDLPIYLSVLLSLCVKMVEVLFETHNIYAVRHELKITVCVPSEAPARRGHWDVCERALICQFEILR